MLSLKRLLTYLGLWLSRGIARLPRPILIGVSRGLGHAVFYLHKSRRAVALKNLSMCFPDKTPEVIASIVKEHFFYYALAFFDRFTLWFSSAEKLEQLVEISGWEHFHAAAGGPVILLVPHFLGMEAGGMRFQKDYKTVNIYSLQRNTVLDAWTLRGRTRFGNTVFLSRAQGIVPVLRYLRQGIPLHYSPDLDLGKKDSIFVKFFGVEASTVTSLVRLAHLTNAVVVPLVTQMTPTGYRARFYPGWTHTKNDPQESLASGVEKMNRFIESRVLEMPAQYLWTHRRFKTRPDHAAPVYG